MLKLPGCDKNMPGCLIAMGRVNRPALMLYGGTIRAGELDGVKLDIVSAFQSYGEYLAGAIDAVNNKISVNINESEMDARRNAWSPPPYKVNRGTLYKYIKTVRSASEGCVTDA